MNAILQALMSQLKTKNANGYQMVNTLMQNGSNPKAIVKQMMSNINPEQKQQILNKAKGFGCPDNILSQLQNMK